MLYGVDVHDGYQRGLSFPTLVAQGYTFAAVKLTQGLTYQRDLGDDWVRAARAAGLIPGGYHWLTSGDGAAQARNFHTKVLEAGGPEGMLIQLDCEDDGYGPQITAWAAEWRRLTGGHPFLIYSGGWWWPRTGGFRGVDVTPYLWQSHYLTADADTVPDDPAAFAARIPSAWWSPGYGGWSTATILQFTSRGDAGMLSNNVDLNVTTLSREQLLALTRAPAARIRKDHEVFLLHGDDNQGYGGQPVLYLCDGRERVALTGINTPNSYGGFQPYLNAGMLLVKTTTAEAKAAGRTIAAQLDALGGELVPAFTPPPGALAAELLALRADVSEVKTAVAQILEALQHGTPLPTEVNLSAESVVAIATAVADEQHDRLAG